MDWVPCIELIRHNEQINDLTFSPNGKLLVAASDNGSIYIWKLADKTIQRIRTHKKPVKTIAFINDDILATGGESGTVRLWDLSDLKGEIIPNRSIKTCKSPITSISFSQKNILAIASKGGSITWLKLSYDEEIGPTDTQEITELMKECKITDD